MCTCAVGVLWVLQVVKDVTDLKCDLAAIKSMQFDCQEAGKGGSGKRAAATFGV